MMYLDFHAGNKDYKLRLNTRAVVSLEKQLGCNPLGIFGNGEEIPTVTVMVTVLHAALQSLEHGITLNDAYDIFDAWLEDGHASVDFVHVILDLYKVSGIVPKEVTAEKN
jgi:hypothetical protein